jgi:hypothetical protein
MLEFTHPGWSNDAVFALNGKAGAPVGGTYRNITEGGLQATDAFAERADGTLVYVPGWGKKGVLIGLAGGDADTFVSDLSVLDVYDIASSQWYHQKTSGTPPGVRVNPCAVIASAPDVSSFNIYLFGGQNLQPAVRTPSVLEELFFDDLTDNILQKQQTQYSDMYILSIPSFTWIEVPQGGDNKPSGRSGHTCHLRDGQLVLVGGYTGTDCDSPGIYVFNATSLEWTSSFKALDHPADQHPENSVLANSFGYAVPDIVASVVGGDASGSATAATPAAGPATGGPFLTGTAPVFTVTATATATASTTGPGVTTTASVTPQPNSSTPSSSDTSPGDDHKGALIAAGVVAGLAGLLALYLGYCAWLYRRQVRAYKTHLAVVNRYSSAASRSRGSFRGLAAFFGRAGSHNKNRRPHESLIAEPVMTEKSSSERRGRTHRRDESTSTSDSFSWVGGQALEPKLLFDDPTPDSAYSGSRPPARYSGQYSGVGSSSRPTPGSEPTPEEDPRRNSGESRDSTEGLLDGQEPSFFSVVLGPRRALRVVNGLEGEEGLERGPSLRR